MITLDQIICSYDQIIWHIDQIIKIRTIISKLYGSIILLLEKKYLWEKEIRLFIIDRISFSIKCGKRYVPISQILARFFLYFCFHVYNTLFFRYIFHFTRSMKTTIFVHDKTIHRCKSFKITTF